MASIVLFEPSTELVTSRTAQGMTRAYFSKSQILLWRTEPTVAFSEGVCEKVCCRDSIKDKKCPFLGNPNLIGG